MPNPICLQGKETPQSLSYPQVTFLEQRLHKVHPGTWARCRWCPGFWWWTPTLVPSAVPFSCPEPALWACTVTFPPGPAAEWRECPLSCRQLWTQCQLPLLRGCIWLNHLPCPCQSGAVESNRTQLDHELGKHLLRDTKHIPIIPSILVSLLGLWAGFNEPALLKEADSKVCIT